MPRTLYRSFSVRMSSNTDLLRGSLDDFNFGLEGRVAGGDDEGELDEEEAEDVKSEPSSASSLEDCQPMCLECGGRMLTSSSKSSSSMGR